MDWALGASFLVSPPIGPLNVRIVISVGYRSYFRAGIAHIHRVRCSQPYDALVSDHSGRRREGKVLYQCTLNCNVTTFCERAFASDQRVSAKKSGDVI